MLKDTRLEKILKEINEGVCCGKNAESSSHLFSQSNVRIKLEGEILVPFY